MANSLSFHWCCLFLLSSIATRPLIEASNGGFNIQLIRRNSPKSPLYNPITHRFQSFYQVPRKSSLSPPSSPLAKVTSNNGDYLMKLSFGTPPMDIYGLADTGSDLVWAQCTPCDGCYQQKNPKFDPQNSKTYSPIPCHSQQCDLVPGGSCSSENLCDYSYAYADSSVTNGVLAKETITLSSSNAGNPVAIGDIIFGCGHKNSGTFNEKDMGLFGLGGGPLSLVSQIGSLYGGRRFSQCLVPFHTDPSVSGIMSFGEGSQVSGDGVVTTPLVYEEGQTQYLVTLEGISVGDTYVPFSNSSQMVSKGNILIDSGTPPTYIPQDFYDRLVKQVKEQVSMSPIEDDPDLGSQLCYTSNDNLQGPLLTAHFEGADVPMMPIQTFIPPKQGVFCFAMAAATDGYQIFGNFAQSNLLIGFDLDSKMVSFKPTDCTQQQES